MCNDNVSIAGLFTIHLSQKRIYCVTMVAHSHLFSSKSPSESSLLFEVDLCFSGLPTPLPVSVASDWRPLPIDWSLTALALSPLTVWPLSAGVTAALSCVSPRLSLVDDFCSVVTLAVWSGQLAPWTELGDGVLTLSLSTMECWNKNCCNKAYHTVLRNDKY